MDKIIRDIPAMPVVAQKAMHMLGDPRATNNTLGEVLASDPSMASRVLQMANSPFFGSRQKIGTISQAIFILGHSTLRSLIITVCTKGLFKNTGLMEEKAWEHSLGVAAAARVLAEETDVMDAGEAFIAGLLHDIGRLIVMVVFQQDSERIFTKSLQQNLSMSETIMLEKEEFGYSHMEIGARVINKWRFPPLFAHVARRHHTQSLQILSQEGSANVIALVGEANHIAHWLGLGRMEPDKTVEVVKTPYAQMLNLELEQVKEIMKKTALLCKKFKDEFKLQFDKF